MGPWVVSGNTFWGQPKKNVKEKVFFVFLHFYQQIWIGADEWTDYSEHSNRYFFCWKPPAYDHKHFTVGAGLRCGIHSVGLQARWVPWPSFEQHWQGAFCFPSACRIARQYPELQCGQKLWETKTTGQDYYGGNFYRKFLALKKSRYGRFQNWRENGRMVVIFVCYNENFLGKRQQKIQKK